MRSSIEIPGVGTFVHEPGGELYRHYVLTLPSRSAAPTRVFAYVKGDELPAHYAMHVRQVFAKVVKDPAAVLVAARAKVEALMESYDLALPPDYHAFAESLHLTHVKPQPEGGAELIFGSCSWFPNFDLTVVLDAELAVARVSFGG